VTYDAYGNDQVINVNQTLADENPTIQLALDNCASVTRIVVDGHSDWGGAIAIQAQ